MQRDCSPNRSETETATVQEANACMAIGAGVGALGAVSAALAGAVCPICWIVAPGLIGLGALKRRAALKQCKLTEAKEDVR